MGNISYDEILQIADEEKIVSLNDLENVIRKLFGEEENGFDDFEEYDYANSSRKKLRDLARLFENKELVFSGTDDDYHNVAVSYARNGLFDYACKILERGLVFFPYSVDLLADLISYRLKSGRDDLCEEPYKTLVSVSKEMWNWRAFSFSIDYRLGRIKHISSNAERGRIIDETLDLSNMFVESLHSDQAYYDKASVVEYKEKIEKGRNKETVESVLREGLDNVKFAPKCALRLADILFDKGEYAEAIIVLKRCCASVFRPQPDISSGYAFLLLALSKASDLFEKNEDKNNISDDKEFIEGMYRDFHTAISNGLNDIYRKTVNSAIKTIEAQTDILYPYNDADTTNYFYE